MKKETLKKKNASSNIRLQHRGMKTSCLGLREQEITVVQKEVLQAQDTTKQVQPVLFTFMYIHLIICSAIFCEPVTNSVRSWSWPPNIINSTSLHIKCASDYTQTYQCLLWLGSWIFECYYDYNPPTLESWKLQDCQLFYFKSILII